MDLLRRMVLMLCVGLGLIGATFGVFAQGTRPGIPVAIYGAPYGNGYHNGYATVAQAIQAFPPLMLAYWGLPESDCPNDNPTYLGDGSFTNHFAYIATSGSGCCCGQWIAGREISYPYDPGKNDGSGCGCDGGEGSGSGSSTSSDGNAGSMVGDPINSATGNQFMEEDDYPDGGWLSFRRFYNSSLGTNFTAIGSQWRQSFDRYLLITASPASIMIFRPDGKYETFTKTSGVWTTDSDIHDVLTETDNSQGTATSYTIFIAANRHYETYNTAGQLQSVIDATGQGVTLAYSTSSTPSTVAPVAGLLITVTDSKGRQLNFTYNSNGQIIQVSLPDGGALTYTYDSTADATTGNLMSVQYPDGHTRQYVYNESSLTGGASLPSAMTGVIDETGTRYLSTAFNSSGAATSSSFAGNVGTTQVAYNTDSTSTVQYPLGETVTLSYATTSTGLILRSAANQPCGPQCNQPWGRL
jgi:YD repeat-containing protein